MRECAYVIGEITANTLLEFFNVPKIRQVVISSPGGDIGYALAMLDDIDAGKLETYATGICQSAAAVLATAGEGRRVCTMDALFRFIPPSLEEVQMPDGTIEKRIPDLRYFLHSVLVARLAQRLKIDKVEAQSYFDGEFISSIRAKELGMIDEVISTEVEDGSSDRLSGSQETSRDANC